MGSSSLGLVAEEQPLKGRPRRPPPAFSREIQEEGKGASRRRGDPQPTGLNDRITKCVDVDHGHSERQRRALTCPKLGGRVISASFAYDVEERARAPANSPRKRTQGAAWVARCQPCGGLNAARRRE